MFSSCTLHGCRPIFLALDSFWNIFHILKQQIIFFQLINFKFDVRRLVAQTISIILKLASNLTTTQKEHADTGISKIARWKKKKNYISFAYYINNFVKPSWINRSTIKKWLSSSLVRWRTYSKGFLWHNAWRISLFTTCDSIQAEENFIAGSAWTPN